MPEQKSKLEQILDEWRADARWDITEPGLAMLTIPNLHAKYVTYLTKARATCRQLEHDLASKRRMLYDYYAGRLTDDQVKALGREPYRFVLKQDLAQYVNSDADILVLETKRAVSAEVVELCTSILKEIGNRTYQLSSVMKWQQFQMGQ